MLPSTSGIRKFTGALLSCAIGLLVTAAGPGAAMDHSRFEKLLGKYVEKGVVDYQGLKGEAAALDSYLALLSETDTETLDPGEQFAFYINAYNAGTLKLILDNYPGIGSIRDIGNRLFDSPFKRKFIRLDGRTVSLDHIEHDILRPRFGDPRVHFAINCASKSCPPLLSRPYRGKTLESQLENAARTFINDPRFNRLESDTLHVSRIFKWFSSDFDDDIPGWFLKYASGDLKKRLERKAPEIDIEYLDYDWSLNGK